MENKSVGWDDFLTSLFQIIIGAKMIETLKSYKLTLTEQQAQQLYQLLLNTKDTGNLKFDGRFVELRPLYEELKPIFDSGIR